MNTKRSRFDQLSVTVDVLVFTVDEGQLKVLLVKRASQPFLGVWSIPGGFVREGESLESAAERVSLDKTGVKGLYLEQLYTFGDPNRDPRARVVTIAYFALVPGQQLKKSGSERVSEINWFAADALPRLAFDHKKIVKYALSRLRAKVSYSNLAFGLLPEKFRLSSLQKIYEVILGKLIDKRNFRKQMLASGLLEATGKKEVDGAHRPAMLYRFKRRELSFLS